jgi:uncharacterized RDD family membrane protein YckC
VLIDRALGFSQQSNNLRNKINFEGSTSDFTVLLVRHLSHYGEVEPGKQALWSILLEAREFVGYDKQQRIDALESVINTTTVTLPAAPPELLKSEAPTPTQSKSVPIQQASIAEMGATSPPPVSTDKQPTTHIDDPKSTTAATNFAPIMFRTVAIAIDFLVFALILYVLAYISGEAANEESSPALVLLALGSNLVYQIFLPSSWDGKTIGKWMMGIKIVSVDGEPLTELQLIKRVIMAYLGTMAVFMGYFVALRSDENRTWHDRAANTRVVKSH